MEELEADLWIPKTAMSQSLTQGLGMKCVMGHLGPWLLLLEQKEYCAAVANDLIQTTTNEADLLKKVITAGEWWVYGYDQQTKTQLLQWKSYSFPHLKKAW